MKPVALLAVGVGCLVAAQCVATFLVTPQREKFTPLQDVYDTLTPGEFAGTLMLGGFRGLACDLLWLRADRAKEAGRLYESMALSQAIAKIQPRFERAWEYMAWDQAYNLSHEVNDAEAKWSWIKAGIETNKTGLERNPQSEKLLRFLAWIFHHKGDLFHDQVERTDWAPLLNPIIERANAECRQRNPAFVDIPALPPGANVGNRNFLISSRLYSLCVAMADNQVVPRTAPFVRRLVCLGIESDGNLLRDSGRHLAAVNRYLDSLERWQTVDAWSQQPADRFGTASEREFTATSYQQNEGRLRRKTAMFLRTLARDATIGEQAAQAVTERKFAEARQLVTQEGAFRPAAVDAVKVVWLDEAGK